jgi:manganese oxidase
MSSSRRIFFQDAAVFTAGLFGLSSRLSAAPPQSSATPSEKNSPHHHTAAAKSKSAPAHTHPYVPVTTPDVPDLPFTLDGATKVFRLRAEPVKRKIAPFKTIDAWGYNGSCPGPTIQVTQGDRVRIIVENALPESTSMHWHGLEVPIEQDGVPWISQKPIPPGATYTYEFTVHQEGTFFYHAHSAMQEMIGLLGLFIAHPQSAYAPHADHDYAIVLQEWAILPSNTVPNTAAMEFNWMTFNGVSSPMTTPLLARLGSRVRLRFVNLGMDHHPIHLHGHQFVMTGTEGGRAPESTWYPMNTVLVGVAQARVVEFEAKYPGAWMLHCHLPHHMMNSMMDLLNNDRMIQTADQTDPKALSQMQTLANTVGFQHMHHSPIAEDANNTKGFPQDAFMEMGMDEAVAKPETHGLPANWSAEMMGMMTLVRVLGDQEYDEIMAMKKAVAQAKERDRDQQS